MNKEQKISLGFVESQSDKTQPKTITFEVEVKTITDGKVISIPFTDKSKITEIATKEKPPDDPYKAAEKVLLNHIESLDKLSAEYKEYMKLGVDMDNEQSKPYYKGKNLKIVEIAKKMTSLHKKIIKKQK
jgi:hypothetical protein